MDGLEVRFIARTLAGRAITPLISIFSDELVIFIISHLFKTSVLPAGLEPATNGLKVRCSTIELWKRICFGKMMPKSFI
jgi:hypothetical protein